MRNLKIGYYTTVGLAAAHDLDLIDFRVAVQEGVHRSRSASHPPQHGIGRGGTRTEGGVDTKATHQRQ